MHKRVIAALTAILLLIVGYSVINWQRKYSPTNFTVKSGADIATNKPSSKPNTVKPAVVKTTATKSVASSGSQSKQGQAALPQPSNEPTQRPQPPASVPAKSTPPVSSSPAGTTTQENSPGSQLSAAEIAQVEQMVLALVNQDREKQGLRPVVWDETAAVAAAQHVQEEVDNGYISHWGMDGSKPQQRYSWAGGLDAVDENESATLWLQGGFSGVTEDGLYKIVSQHEASMLMEQAPNDGHRRNILDPQHTGLGVAIAVGKYGVAMAQEFTNHYAVLNPIPLTDAAGSIVTCSGRIFSGYQIQGIYAVWEQAPQPMTPAQLRQTDTYSDPPWSNLYFWARPDGPNYYVEPSQTKLYASNVEVDSEGNFAVKIPLSATHVLDYISVDIAPKTNLSNVFCAGQFVLTIDG
ncbi:MAG: CAP domain-containing protein [Peptococcaceae bacterium]|nr:CAP domain-containing protein [Peptococcaceae bacterium]